MKPLFASNAMATKAKAMYGNRLKFNDYQELLHRHSVAEITSYLKNDTYYHEFMEQINENTIHRGHLELILRQSYYKRFLKLLRYSSRDHSFYRYGVIQVEITQILATLRSLKEGDTVDSFLRDIELSSQYTTFDMQKLLFVKRYDDLVEVLKPTIYHSVLQSLHIQLVEDIDYTKCEIAFKNFYYDYIMNIISKEFKGKNRTQVYSLFAAEMELDNFSKIYRLKKYYQATPEEIKGYLTPNFHKVPKKTLYGWIDNFSADEFLSAIESSPYQTYMKKKEFVYIEYHLNSVKYNLSKHHMRFSNNPDLILLSYMQVLNTELQNLIEIIEGTRYHVNPDAISKLLID